jgi:hypothetical protein
MREFKIDGFNFRQVGSVKSGPCSAHMVAPQHEWLGRDEKTGIWGVMHELPIMWGEAPYCHDDFRGYNTYAEPFRVSEDAKWLQTIGHWLVRGYHDRTWSSEELIQWLTSSKKVTHMPKHPQPDGPIIVMHIREEVIAGARVTFEYLHYTWSDLHDWGDEGRPEPFMLCKVLDWEVLHEAV